MQVEASGEGCYQVFTDPKGIEAEESFCVDVPGLCEARKGLVV